MGNKNNDGIFDSIIGLCLIFSSTCLSCITAVKEGPIVLLLFGVAILFVGSTVFTYGLKAMIKTNSYNTKELK